MKKFALLYSSRTYASIADRAAQQTLSLPAWQFTFQDKDIRVKISDSLQAESGIHLHRGLLLMIDVSAASEDEAQEIAHGRCELILSLITLVTQASCDGAKLEESIEIRPQEPFPFTSISYASEGDDVGPHSLRKINEQRFTAVFDAFLVNTPIQERIARALSWLRKGINERDPMDEFVSYWVGIEIIAALLRDKLKMRSKDPGRWDGVKDIFSAKLGVDYFDKIKDARDELLHGFKELDITFITRVHSYREPTRQALVLGICDLLGLPPEIEAETLAEKVLRGSRVWTVIRGSLTGIPPNFDELTLKFPRMHVELSSAEVNMGEGGTINKKVSTRYKHIGPDQAKWAIESLELRGDSDAGIQGAHIGLRDIEPKKEA